MYTNLLAIARRVLGYGLAEHLVWIAPLLAVIAAIVLCIPAWRRREEAALDGKGRLPMLTLFAAAWFKLLVAGATIGLLAAALLAQKGLFSERHGRVTERNYNAVKTKWGVPHEQRDLTVSQYVMRKVIEEEVADGSRRTRKLPERQAAQGKESRIVLDEERITYTPEEAKSQPRRVVRRVTALVREHVEQESIRTVDVKIGLRSNPRRLGGAAYAGYDDRWQLKYTVHNESPWATQGLFHFPLPAEGYGLYDQLVVKVDGKDWIPQVRYRRGSLAWRMLMQPGASHEVEIGYVSRGLEYFRYKPRNMRERCVVTVHVQGIDAGRINFPIGAMPPKDDLKALSGDSYALHWDLSRAVTNLDIGIIVPTARQPGYHVTRLLAGAPLGLALLALSLFVTRWLLTGRFDLVPVCLVSLSYYVAHALLANLNDVIPSFMACFVLSMAFVICFLLWFWEQLDGSGRLSLQSAVLTSAFFVLYPSAVLVGDGAGTYLHIFYAVLLAYVLGLVASKVAGGRREHPSAIA